MNTYLVMFVFLFKEKEKECFEKKKIAQRMSRGSRSSNTLFKLFKYGKIYSILVLVS